MIADPPREPCGPERHAVGGRRRVGSVRVGARVLLLASVLGACSASNFEGFDPSCDPAKGPCPPGEGSSSTGAADEPAPPTGGIQTVTGGDPTTGGTTGTTGSTGGAPAEPAIVTVELAPDPLELVGAIVVDVVAEHADGVRMQLEGAEPTELAPAKDGHFTGAIEVLSGLANGPHAVTFTPWQGADEGPVFAAQYTVALPEAGSEAVWDATPDLGQGEVDALAVTASGHLLAFGTYYEGNAARCFLHRRGLDGSPTADTVQVFPGQTCSAVDVVAGDGEGFWLLATVESGNGPRWRLASGAWGEAPIVVRTGAQGEVAHALARSALGQLVACGTGPSPFPVFDVIDGRVWRIQGPATELDYVPGQGLVHNFDETVRDCAFAGEQLRLVGEVFGPHEKGPMNVSRKRPFLLELDSKMSSPLWGVPGLGPGNTTQGGATSLAIDDQGRALMGLYTCSDDCQPEAELRRYDVDGTLDWQVTLPANVSIPRALAWSPAGYVVTASAEVINDAETKFLLQAYVPGKLAPAWSYAKATLPGLHYAQAVALAPAAVIGGGFGSGGFWTLAFVAP